MKKHIFKSKLNLIVAALLIITLVAFGFGCSEDLGVKKDNQPPTVWLSSAPPEGSTSTYTIQMFWGGWDPDGEISYYEYAVTDNDSGFFDPADTTGRDKWHKVFANDSLFTFTADVVADSSDIGGTMEPIEFIRTHTFLIRAVDEEGMASAEPAYRSFTARTLSPEISIRVPVYTGLNPALLPPITKFTWEGRDYVDNVRISQDPDSVRWILVPRFENDVDWQNTLRYIRQNPDAKEWSKWHYYLAPMDSGKNWTTPPLEFGGYMFAIQAKDEAGAFTPVFDERRNVRRLLVSKRSTGPLLIANNGFIGTFKSTTATTSLSIVDMPANVPLIFEWSASAESYGGVVPGYRYGWDINDLNNDDQWAVDWTPFTATTAESPSQTWFFGTHTFHVEAIDNSGYVSRIGIKINIVPFTMERNLLVVDDFYEDPATAGWGVTRGALPSDEQHDDFWTNALINVDGYEPAIDMIEVSTNDPLPIDKLAQYKNVIWDTYGGYSLLSTSFPFLYDVIRFIPKDPDVTIVGRVQPNLLALFMAAGGHVLLCGQQPMTMVFNVQFLNNKRFPFIFQYELRGDQDGNYDNQIDNPVGDRSFAYRDMCLDVMDIAYTNWNLLRRPGAQENGCGVTHLRVVDKRIDGLRECLPLDENFPLLTLRPECSSFGKAYAEDKAGLNDEIYNPPYFRCGQLNLGPRDCFEPIYGHGCLNQSSSIYNAPNAAWSLTFAHVDPDVDIGVSTPARSAVWGFEPAYFDTTQTREALEYIIFEEWLLPRK
jgi:hypothetical protein